MTTLFISDLHLSLERPDKIRLFGELLRQSAGRVDALYILGDLFEVWVGDDDDTPPYPALLAELKQFAASGTPLYVMRGNRDFLMGSAFEAATGARLLDDPTIIDLYGEQTLVMHGDLLCSRDVAYQKFRRKVRDPDWQRRFLRLPLWLRKLSGKLARLRSRLALLHKHPDIMDVEQGTVQKTVLAHGVSRLIHGHTHRPGIHEFVLQGAGTRRIVLGDWYEQDSVLVCGPDHQQLMSVAACMASLDAKAKT